MQKNRLGRVLALGAALALGVTACAQGGNQDTTDSQDSAPGIEDLKDPEPAPPPAKDAVMAAGDGKGKCDNPKIAYIGTIAGENAALGMNILYGVRLAVKEHNDANPNCQVKLEEFDTEGSPDRAPGVVNQAINDPDVLGVVGLPFSGESKAVGDRFDEAGLTTVTPAATNPALTNNGWKTFFRGLGNDNVQGPAAAKFIENSLNAKSVCIVKDDSEYGIGLANQVKKSLGDKVSCEEEIKTKQKEFSAVTQSIVSDEPDAIFFSGYYTEAAPFAQQLRDTGSQTLIVAPDGVRDDEYIKNAGEASEGTLLSCPCLPTGGLKEFTKEYKKISNGREPSTYSPEGYDTATVLLQGLDNGVDSRPEMLKHVQNYDGQGLTKKFNWDDKGELKDTPIWAYYVKDGEIVQYQDLSD